MIDKLLHVINQDFPLLELVSYLQKENTLSSVTAMNLVEGATPVPNFNSKNHMSIVSHSKSH